MGSTKYPEENGLDDFLVNNGGYTNAQTDAEEVRSVWYDINMRFNPSNVPPPRPLDGTDS